MPPFVRQVNRSTRSTLPVANRPVSGGEYVGTGFKLATIVPTPDTTLTKMYRMRLLPPLPPAAPVGSPANAK